MTSLRLSQQKTWRKWMLLRSPYKASSASKFDRLEINNLWNSHCIQQISCDIKVLTKQHTFTLSVFGWFHFQFLEMCEVLIKFAMLVENMRWSFALDILNSKIYRWSSKQEIVDHYNENSRHSITTWVTVRSTNVVCRHRITDCILLNDV